MNDKLESRPKNVECDKLQALLEEKISKKQQMIFMQSNVALQAIFDTLRAFKKIEKIGKCVPRNPKKLQIERQMQVSKTRYLRYKKMCVINWVLAGNGKLIFS